MCTNDRVLVLWAASYSALRPLVFAKKMETMMYSITASKVEDRISLSQDDRCPYWDILYVVFLWEVLEISVNIGKLYSSIMHRQTQDGIMPWFSYGGEYNDIVCGVRQGRASVPAK